MDVTVENDQIDSSIPRVQGIPAIDTQSAETKVADRRRRYGGHRRHHRHPAAHRRSAGSALRQLAGGRQPVQAHHGQLHLSGASVLPYPAHPAGIIAVKSTEGSAVGCKSSINSIEIKPEPDRIGSGLFFRLASADALLVTHLPNIAYLCGFTGSAGVLLVEASRATLFTDSRYTFQAREEVSGATSTSHAGPAPAARRRRLKRRRGTPPRLLRPRSSRVAQKRVLGRRAAPEGSLGRGDETPSNASAPSKTPASCRNARSRRADQRRLAGVVARPSSPASPNSTSPPKSNTP